MLTLAAGVLVDDQRELFEVRLLDVPLVLRERSSQHGADLLRELDLIRVGRQTRLASQDVPRRLLELAEELRVVYGPYIAGPVDEMDAALARGEKSLPEVVYRIPAASVQFVHRVDEVLREVEEYTRVDGELLTLAPPADVVAYRKWAISEVQRQHAGHPPTPWPEFAAASGI